MPIPLKVALYDRETGEHRGEELLILDEAEKGFNFSGFAKPPILSINRGFSAPVTITRNVPREDLVFLAAKDDDPFARYEAMQELAVAHLVAVAAGGLSDGDRMAGEDAIAEALGAILTDDALDDAMRGELMMLPSESYLFEQMVKPDPAKIHEAREGVKKVLGTKLKSEFHALYERAEQVPYDGDGARGARKVKTQVLTYAAASDPAKAAELAAHQYDRADNMTDRQGALMVLCGLECPERTARLLDFYNRYQGNALVIDKWFTLQALSLHPQALEHVKALSQHPDFTLKNPNRVRSLYMAFAGNPQAFHAADGEGYRLLADLILELDPINPQTAARFVPSLGKWRKIEPGRAELMRGELERIARAGNLSRDTYEQVTRSLEG